MAKGGPQKWATLLVTAAVTAEAVGFVAWARSRFKRYEIDGQSMAPALRPGDFVIVDRQAFALRAPRPGDVVLAHDPRDPARMLVKRIASVNADGGLWLAGDNPDDSTDSREFGPVPAGAIVGQVRWRYWPLSRPFGVG